MGILEALNCEMCAPSSSFELERHSLVHYSGEIIRNNPTYSIAITIFLFMCTYVLNDKKLMHSYGTPNVWNSITHNISSNFYKPDTVFVMRKKFCLSPWLHKILLFLVCNAIGISLYVLCCGYQSWFKLCQPPKQIQYLKDAWNLEEGMSCKGGWISESFSFWLKSPNKGAKSLSWALSL